ncbi:hypothetical protein [Pseudonocardia yuanmonensis]
MFFDAVFQFVGTVLVVTSLIVACLVLVLTVPAPPRRRTRGRRDPKK